MERILQDGDFDRQLAVARTVILSHMADPWKAVEPFDLILEELQYNPSVREDRLPTVRELGRQLFEALRTSREPVAMEVRHFCWHLQRLGEESSIKDLRIVTLTRFAHAYPSHPVERCPLCAEYPNDLPYRYPEGGRAHFHEWLARRKRGTDA